MLATTKNFFIKAWQGKLSLPMAFFVLYYLPLLSVKGTVFLIMYSLHPEYYTFNDMDNFMAHMRIFDYSISSALLPYTIFTVVCVWRCAKNSSLFWLLISRIIVVFALIMSVINSIGLIAYLGRSDSLYNNSVNHRLLSYKEKICNPGKFNDVFKSYKNFPSSSKQCLLEVNKIIDSCSNKDKDISFCIMTQVERAYGGGEQAIKDRSSASEACMYHKIREKHPNISQTAIQECDSKPYNEFLQCIGMSTNEFDSVVTLCASHLVISRCVATKMKVSITSYDSCAYEKNPTSCYKALGYSSEAVEELKAACASKSEK